MAKPPPRRLFLDDDPARAEAFLARHPDAIWVQDVAGCVARLAEAWDEVHLDHDLGGEVYVDPARDDCGMAVVRWMALEPRPHLARARFTVHSHNMMAALLMVQDIRAQGFRVEARPFGLDEPAVEASPRAAPGWARSFLRWFRRGSPGRKPAEVDEPPAMWP